MGGPERASVQRFLYWKTVSDQLTLRVPRSPPPHRPAVFSSPDTFVWLHVRTRGGQLEGFDSVVPTPLLHRLGGVPRVVVWLEGEPSGRSGSIGHVFSQEPFHQNAQTASPERSPSCSKPLWTIILTLLVTCSLWGWWIIRLCSNGLVIVSQVKTAARI